MENQDSRNDRAYFAQRAQEELALAEAASGTDAADAHRKLQRIYLERASTGAREMPAQDEVG